jgi:hypothetical protein
MRHLLAIAVLALAACGNYSNDDIAFLDALPDKGAVQVNVPQNQSALTRTASLYTGTVQTAQSINTGVGSIFDAIDTIRTIAPSARSADSRTWGPFPDKDLRFEDEAVITRTGTSDFDFHFDQRPAGQGKFVKVITGSFAGVTAHAGHGSLEFEQDALDSIGHPSADPNLRSLRFVYANDATPRTVTTTIIGRNATNGQTATLTYTYSESASEGDLDFDLAGPTEVGPFDLRVRSRWIPDGGRGRATGLGSVPLIAGLQFSVDQCWDDSFNETFYDSVSWFDGGNPLAPHGDFAGLDCDAGAGLPLQCPRGDAGSCAF